MLEALFWAAASGWLARFALPRETAGPLVTLLCGIGGSALGYTVSHGILRLHEWHLFDPESLLPGALGSLVLLLVVRRLRFSDRRRTLFT